ncbi:MAG: hypothetical protein ACREFX_08155 [Opitutaceae bacterium]
MALAGAAAVRPSLEARGIAAPPATVAVDRFEFSYGLAHPKLPALALVEGIGVRLSFRDGAWHEPGGAGIRRLVLSRVPPGSAFDAGALRDVAKAVVAWFNARGLDGVWVNYPEIDAAGAGLADSRPAKDRTAHIVIWVSQIARVRTLARGGRFKPRDSIDNRKYNWIIADSPLKPGKAPGQPGDLFREKPLDAYIATLSLHPGRRVEASIASSGEPGKVVLDYLVNEPTPWRIFAQVSNTGTASTGEWRERLGFQDDQLTNHDDILDIDAITTPNGKTYGLFLSYSRPVLRPETLMLHVYGSYGDFVAEDATLEDLQYVGKNWLTGAALGNHLALPWGLSLDSDAGADFKHYAITTKIGGSTLVKGSSNFLVPYVDGTLSRGFRDASISGSLRLDTTAGSVADTSSASGVPTLGRAGADAQWTSLTGNLSESLYLDRLFSRSESVGPPIQELNVLLRGRLLLRGDRLIPQEEEPLGGLFTVRGYPNSIVSADDYGVATLEYAFHVARAFRPGEPGTLLGRPFRWRPTSSRLAPDWDLILRGFYDYGYRGVGAYNAPGQQPTPPDQVPLIEKNLTMAGAGGGAELDFRQVFSVRCDIGVALNPLTDPSLPAGQQIVVRSGSVQSYLVATFAW